MREWLKSARKKRKISAAEMAESLGYSVAGYYYIESGKRQKHLNIDIVSRLSEKLGMPIEDIMREERIREDLRLYEYRNGQRV